MTKRIPGWVVYVPHLNAAYPIAYWVRDSVAVTITDDYGNTRTETYKVDDVFTAAPAKYAKWDFCVDKARSMCYTEYIAVRRRSPCRRRAKLCPEPRTLRGGQLI